MWVTLDMVKDKSSAALELVDEYHAWGSSTRGLDAAAADGTR